MRALALVLVLPAVLLSACEVGGGDDAVASEVRLADDHRLAPIQQDLDELQAHIDGQVAAMGWTEELKSEQADIDALRIELGKAANRGGVQLEIAATSLAKNARDLDQRVRVDGEGATVANR